MKAKRYTFGNLGPLQRRMLTHVEKYGLTSLAADPTTKAVARRLIARGLVEKNEHGQISLALPR